MSSQGSESFFDSDLGHVWSWQFLFSEAFLEFIELIPEAVIFSDPAGQILLTNGHARELFGYTAKDFADISIEALVPLAHRKHHPQFREAFFKDPKPRHLQNRNFELSAVKANGDEFSMEAALFALRTEKGLLAVNLIRDVTQVKEQQAIISEYAFVDVLTGLPNRRYFEENLKRNIAKARRHQQGVGLIFVDLDGFKEVNDTHGHDVGDQLLRALSSKMQHVLREGDFVARLGGDEFVIMLYPISTTENVEKCAEHVLGACRESISAGKVELAISASLGICLAEGEQLDYESLLKKADEALYEVKRSGKNSWKLYKL